MDYAKDVSVIILAAGKGKRMKSEIPKVLQKINEKPIIYYILSETRKLGPRNIFAVIGHKSDMVRDYLESDFPEVLAVVQEKQLGTADAVRTVMKQEYDFGKYTLVLVGDCPLISVGTLKSLIECKLDSRVGAAILTSDAADPTGYGRIILDKEGRVKKVVEEKDASPREKLIKEINASVYCFDTDLLKKYINYIGSDNSQEEYYLTDMVEILIKNGKDIKRLKVPDEYEVMGINDRKQLEAVQKIMQERNKSKSVE